MPPAMSENKAIAVCVIVSNEQRTVARIIGDIEQHS